MKKINKLYIIAIAFLILPIPIWIISSTVFGSLCVSGQESSCIIKEIINFLTSIAAVFSIPIALTLIVIAVIKDNKKNRSSTRGIVDKS